MKYAVKIGDQTFNVEIKDINTRPIIALVEGEAFEVMPENGSKATGSLSPVEKAEAVKAPAKQNSVSATASAPNQTLSSGVLTAPLPGTVIETFVHAGDVIEAGQVMLIIEAMKMKNSIRATHGDQIAEVLVSAGQTVMHKQALVKFEDKGQHGF